jgi:hypothetical protein
MNAGTSRQSRALPRVARAGGVARCDPPARIRGFGIEAPAGLLGSVVPAASAVLLGPTTTEEPHREESGDCFLHVPTVVERPRGA